MSGAQSTTVVCLRGKIREYGPRLERAPAGFVYVGRRLTMGGWRLPRSVWANPFSVKGAGSAEAAVEQHEQWMAEPDQADLRARLPELRGAVLGCWCPAGVPCHAVLLARWAAYGFPGDDAFDLECWLDFSGRLDDFASRAPSRTVETVTGVGRWAGAL